MINIIDVSTHNGAINWEKAKNNIDGAIIRCGFGMDIASQDDAQYKRNIEECIRLDIPFGVYLYSYANTVEKAKSEAEHVLRLVNNYKDKIKLHIWYDIEDKIQLNLEKNTLTNIITTFCNKIAENGLSVGIYANNNWLRNRIDKCIQDKYLIWSAGYGNNDGQAHEEAKYNHNNVICWQYSSNGNIDGVGRCDVNYYYKEITKNETVKTKKSIDEIAQEVINNKWDVQPRRKQLLEQAGYNYKEVQAKVNEILLGKKSTVDRKSNEQIANEVIAGKWDVQPRREQLLKAEGYDYNAIQKIVNQKLK